MSAMSLCVASSTKQLGLTVGKFAILSAQTIGRCTAFVFLGNLASIGLHMFSFSVGVAKIATLTAIVGTVNSPIAMHFPLQLVLSELLVALLGKTIHLDESVVVVGILVLVVRYLVSFIAILVLSATCNSRTWKLREAIRDGQFMDRRILGNQLSVLKVGHHFEARSLQLRLRHVKQFGQFLVAHCSRKRRYNHEVFARCILALSRAFVPVDRDTQTRLKCVDCVSFGEGFENHDAVRANGMSVHTKCSLNEANFLQMIVKEIHCKQRVWFPVVLLS